MFFWALGIREQSEVARFTIDSVHTDRIGSSVHIVLYETQPERQWEDENIQNGYERMSPRRNFNGMRAVLLSSQNTKAGHSSAQEEEKQGKW